jgi:carboxypeptidase C (cathepsin A)
MTEKSLQSSPAPHSPPTGSKGTINWNGKRVDYQCDFILLTNDDRPVAELFYTSYTLPSRSKKERPVTFVFNGGPGAASAYLHIGALGPLRITFGKEGQAPSLPNPLVENRESWLHFTDLVFLDPIGTGFSRAIQPDESASPEVKQRASEEKSSFFKLSKDLDALCESIERILTKFRRWKSPVYIAGESYGGFRVGKLARKLQERFGIGLSGAFLISPAMEFTSLEYTDYNVTPWLGVFPSLAATAWWHRGGNRGGKKGERELQRVLDKSEDFTRRVYSQFLVDGVEPPGLFTTIAQELHLDPQVVARHRGRISPFHYFRELLQDEAKVFCFYDSSVTTPDPFPDRPYYDGADISTAVVGIPFTHGINALFSGHLKLNVGRTYNLLSYDVFNQWKIDTASSSIGREIGASDDLRSGLALNSSMRVHISHGVFDLVTPYFATKRILNLSNIPKSEQHRIHSVHYFGGHMFYSWEVSRQAFFRDAKAVYQG